MTEQKAKEIEELARQVKPLQMYVVSCGVSIEDAEDIVQNSFLRVFTWSDTLPESLEEQKAVFVAEVKLRTLAYFKEQQRLQGRAARAHEYALFTGATYERDISQVLEAREQLELVLPSITEKQWQILTDKVLDELTFSEVAERRSMNPNTAKWYWRQALETLREKLQRLEQRGVRGAVVFVVISSILALAKNAHAMVGWLKRFLQSAGQMQMRKVAGLATAVMVVVLPPNFDASAESEPIGTNDAFPASVGGAITTPAALSLSMVKAEKVIEAVPSVTVLPSLSVSPVVTRKVMGKKSTINTPPPDYLLGMVIWELRSGKPERALELLDQYTSANPQAAKAGSVQSFRAQANRAIAARH